MARISNQDIAEIFERVADLLEAQHASVFRVGAYRKAADVIRNLEEPLEEIYSEGGRKAVRAIPGLGESLTGAVVEILTSGRLGMLDRLEGEVSPEDLFTTVPGIGEELAHRIHDTLGVETLEELELAAHDGRLETVPGFGRRRIQAVREVLGSLLSRSSRRRGRLIARKEAGAGGSLDAPPREHVPREAPTVAVKGHWLDVPPVDVLLSVDEEYRRRATRGELKTITPRRFNPEKEAWLPVMHTERDPWHFTALFSNTARAHKLGRTRDWVVLYFERDGHEGQVTVVTEYQGDLAGMRVVRGREAECREHYDEAAAASV
jgi:hypothetical protein